MICSLCGKEVGKLFCGHCRERLRKEMHQSVPVLFFDQETKMYRAGCSVIECPCNDHGLCSSRISLDTFLAHAHEYDGDNCIKLVCG